MKVAWGENRAQLNRLFTTRHSLLKFQRIDLKHYGKFISLRALHFFNYTS